MIVKFDGYGSHLLILDEIFKNRPIKKVLEFGPGSSSTPFFREEKKVELVSIESESPEWYEKVKVFNPSVKWIATAPGLLGFADNLNERFDMVLVDTVNDLRWHLINRVQRVSNIIVAHDTEQSLLLYELGDLKEGFYYADFVLHRPWTGVYTNDLELMNILKRKHPYVSYDNFKRDKIYLY